MASSATIPLADAARALDVAPPVLRRLASSPRPPLSIFRDPNGQEVIRRSQLRAYLERRLEPHYQLRTAAKLLDVNESTIHRWIRSGRLSAVRINGLRRIPESAILGALHPAP